MNFYFLCTKTFVTDCIHMMIPMQRNENWTKQGIKDSKEEMKARYYSALIFYFEDISNIVSDIPALRYIALCSVSNTYLGYPTFSGALLSDILSLTQFFAALTTLSRLIYLLSLSCFSIFNRCNRSSSVTMEYNFIIILQSISIHSNGSKFFFNELI